MTIALHAVLPSLSYHNIPLTQQLTVDFIDPICFENETVYSEGSQLL